MGGGASTTKGRNYAQTKTETAIETETPSNVNNKGTRESKKLQKMALGQIDREYEKGVNFNKVNQVDWDDSKISSQSNQPISKSQMNPTDQKSTQLVIKTITIIQYSIYEK